MIHVPNMLKAAAPMFDKLWNEGKTVPATIIAVCILYIAVTYLFVDRGSVREQLTSIQYTQHRDHLDTRLHAVQTEEFTLSQHVTLSQEKHEPIDPLYANRIDALKKQEARILRQIGKLDSMDSKGAIEDKEDGSNVID
jgi:hypothetical protein